MVTGYFKWCLTQSPEHRRTPPEGAGEREPGYEAGVEPRLPSQGGSSRESKREARVEPRSPSGSASSSSARTTGFTSPGSPHTVEDFCQKPDWLVPQRSSSSSFLDAATSLRRETERAYFASLWKKIYVGRLESATHWAYYSDQDKMLKKNKLSVEEGAPWEAFARFAQKHIQ